jgi:hypothetical protein
VPEPGTIALDLTCAECGRSPRPGETRRILFADVGEAFIFCPECAEREFDEYVHMTATATIPRSRHD